MKKEILLSSFLLFSLVGCQNISLVCCQNNNSSSSMITGPIVSSVNNSSSSYFNSYDYINYVQYEDLAKKIEAKEDFIFVIGVSNCHWCKMQFDNIYDYLPLMPQEIDIYYFDDLFINIELDMQGNPLKGEELYNKAKEEYRYFANLTQSVYDTQNGEGAYIQEFVTNRFGEEEPSLVYPVTFMYIAGELVKEFSCVGYGWTQSENSYKTFINLFNNLRGKQND